MQRASQNQDENVSRSEDSQPTREQSANMTQSSSGSSQSNILVYPLCPHVGYLVLPRQVASSEGGVAEQPVQVVWDDSWFRRLGDNLRPITFGRTLPNGRVIYNFWEQRAVLLLPPTRFFETSQSADSEPVAGPSNQPMNSGSTRSHQTYRLRQHNGLLRLGRVNEAALRAAAASDLSAQEGGDYIFCNVPDGYVRYNLQGPRGRLYLPPPNNSTLAITFPPAAPNPQPHRLPESSDSESFSSDEEFEPRVARRRRLQSERDRVLEHRRERAERILGRNRQRRQLPPPFIRYPIKRRKFFKRW